MTAITIKRESATTERVGFPKVPFEGLYEIGCVDTVGPIKIDGAVVYDRADATPKDKLLARIGKRMFAFYDWLSGPPMSERERMRSILIRAENDRFLYSF